MKKPVIALLTLALLAAVDSKLQKTLGQDASPATPEAKITPTEQTQANQDKLRAEAKAIWASARALDRDWVKKRLLDFKQEANADRRYEILLSIGMTLSLSAFDRCESSVKPPEEGDGEWHRIEKLIHAWCDESPRAGIAWATSITEDYLARIGTTANFASFNAVKTKQRSIFGSVNKFLCRCTDAITRDLDAWRAFVLEGGQPEWEEFAELWIQEARDPGSIWTFFRSSNLRLDDLGNYLLGMLQAGEDDKALLFLNRAPDGVERMFILGYASNLAPKHLRMLAKDLFQGDAETSNFLLAMAGDKNASYLDAVREPLRSSGEGSYANLKRLLSQWPEKDLGAGISWVAEEISPTDLATFMEMLATKPNMTEKFIANELAQTTAEKRDSALVAYFTALSAKNRADVLRRIMQSEEIEDQWLAIERVLRDWAWEEPENAADWLRKLPTAKDHPELAVAIARSWYKTNLEAAVKLTQEFGVGLNEEMIKSIVNSQPPEAVKKVLPLLRHDPEYNELVYMTAEDLISDPPEALKFIKEQVQGPWPSVFVDQVNTWLDTHDKRGTIYLPALSSLDLSSVPPEKIQQLRKPRPQP